MSQDNLFQSNLCVGLFLLFSTFFSCKLAYAVGSNRVDPTAVRMSIPEALCSGAREAYTEAKTNYDEIMQVCHDDLESANQDCEVTTARVEGFNSARVVCNEMHVNCNMSCTGTGIKLIDSNRRECNRRIDAFEEARSNACNNAVEKFTTCVAYISSKGYGGTEIGTALEAYTRALYLAEARSCEACNNDWPGGPGEDSKHCAGG